MVRAKERGASKNEIFDVINTGKATDAKYGKMAKYKIYKFNKNWLGKYYNQKMIKVLYTYEGNTIITVTVYVFYGDWGN